MCEDICGGQENLCIPASNENDVPPVAPSGKFSYVIFCLKVCVIIRERKCHGETYRLYEIICFFIKCAPLDDIRTSCAVSDLKDS